MANYSSSIMPFSSDSIVSATDNPKWLSASDMKKFMNKKKSQMLADSGGKKVKSGDLLSSVVQDLGFQPYKSTANPAQKRKIQLSLEREQKKAETARKRAQLAHLKKLERNKRQAEKARQKYAEKTAKAAAAMKAKQVKSSLKKHAIKPVRKMTSAKKKQQKKQKLTTAAAVSTPLVSASTCASLDNAIITAVEAERKRVRRETLVAPDCDGTDLCICAPFHKKETLAAPELKPIIINSSDRGVDQNCMITPKRKSPGLTPKSLFEHTPELSINEKKIDVTPVPDNDSQMSKQQKSYSDPLPVSSGESEKLNHRKFKPNFVIKTSKTSIEKCWGLVIQFNNGDYKVTEIPKSSHASDISSLIKDREVKICSDRSPSLIGTDSGVATVTTAVGADDADKSVSVIVTPPTPESQTSSETSSGVIETTTTTAATEALNNSGAVSHGIADLLTPFKPLEITWEPNSESDFSNFDGPWDTPFTCGKCSNPAFNCLCLWTPTTVLD
jgi:hypothetical protein